MTVIWCWRMSNGSARWIDNEPNRKELWPAANDDRSQFPTIMTAIQMARNMIANWLNAKKWRRNVSGWCREPRISARIECRTIKMNYTIVFYVSFYANIIASEYDRRIIETNATHFSCYCLALVNSFRTVRLVRTEYAVAVAGWLVLVSGTWHIPPNDRTANIMLLIIAITTNYNRDK